MPARVVDAQLAIFGEQTKRVHMAGSEDAKVAVVQGGQLWFVEPFDNCKNGRVHEADVGIRVTVADLAGAPVVLELQLLNAICPRGDVIQKGEENPGVEPGVHEPVHLD